MNNKTSSVFLHLAEAPWTAAGAGIQRQVMGYDPTVMLVKVKFEKGAVSDKHAHPHSQTTCVVSGSFILDVDGEQQVLSAGDGFYIPPGALHGVSCLEAGVLLDAFSPYREDFL